MAQLREVLISARDAREPVVCIGAGLSGCAAAAFLERRGVQVVLLERRCEDEVRSLTPVARAVDNLTARGGIVFYQVDRPGDLPMPLESPLVIVSPGVPLDNPLIDYFSAQGALILGEVELGTMLVPVPKVIVTGSNGKSTTVSVIQQILTGVGIRSLLCGNVGMPVLEALDDFVDADFLPHVELKLDMLVIEASSYQLESTVALAPEVAVFLNLSENHLERHGTMERYFAAKAAPFRRQSAADGAVLVVDDAYAARLAREVQSTVVTVSGTRPKGQEYAVVVADEHLEVFWEGQSNKLPLHDFPLPGVHNRYNLGCAVAVALRMGVDIEALPQQLKRLHGMPYRLQPEGEVLGLHWINDSKATTVSAVLVALRTVCDGIATAGSGSKVVVLVGGVPKAQSPWCDVTELLNQLQPQVRQVITFGAAGAYLSTELQQVIVPVCATANLAAALSRAAEDGEKGDTVLISPGCASFDEFRGFEERGEAISAWLRVHR